MSTETSPRRIENLHTDKGKIPVYATGTVEQPFETYSSVDHATWTRLFLRQQTLLRHRACAEFGHAQTIMGMGAERIPRFSDLNCVLGAATGWQLIGVEGLLPELDFFEHLAHRRFPVTWWIRRPEQMDYIEEPDLFHDLYGHVPLLMDPAFADYIQAYGRGGVKAHGIGSHALQSLTRLYWYTVEFGLIRQRGQLRIYGAGIVSSSGESVHALESTAPYRIGFDLERIMRTGYRIDSYQNTYFVIDSFQQLMNATAADFTPVYARVAGQEPISADSVLAGDVMIGLGGEGGQDSGNI